AFSRRTRCAVTVYALAGEGDEVQTGDGYSVARAAGDLDLEKAAADAVRRSTRMLGARTPPSARVVVVLEPDVTSTLLSVLVGARAVALAPGDRTPEEIRRTVGDGLLVQSVSGVHSGVNPVSGDFSVAAEGLMIRDGQIAEPVREITIASTIQRMLKEAVAA